MRVGDVSESESETRSDDGRAQSLTRGCCAGKQSLGRLGRLRAGSLTRPCSKQPHRLAVGDDGCARRGNGIGGVSELRGQVRER